VIDLSCELAGYTGESPVPDRGPSATDRAVAAVNDTLRLYRPVFSGPLSGGHVARLSDLEAQGWNTTPPWRLPPDPGFDPTGWLPGQPLTKPLTVRQRWGDPGRRLRGDGGPDC
jgi:hypothetical protein